MHLSLIHIYRNFWILLIMLLAGIVLGGFMGQMAEGIPWLGWLNFGQSFGLDSPLVVNFGILVITFGLTIKITMASIIGAVSYTHLDVYKRQHTVTYEFYRNYFSTSGGRGILEYSQIQRICETNQCLVLYTRDHGGYLLDKKQMGAVCLSGLRALLTERSGRAVRWVQVREFTPEKNN